MEVYGQNRGIEMNAYELANNLENKDRLWNVDENLMLKNENFFNFSLFNFILVRGGVWKRIGLGSFKIKIFLKSFINL